MDELTLYRVGARGRLNLEGVVDPAVEFYAADVDPSGVISLRPIHVKTIAAKRQSGEPEPQD